MAHRNLEQAVQAIQNGNHEEGARLLRIELKEQQMPPPLRAVALMWLAETNPDLQFKIQCYRQANQADPNNQDAARRLSLMLSQQLPNNPPAQGNFQQGDTGPLASQNMPQTPPQQQAKQQHNFWLDGDYPNQAQQNQQRPFGQQAAPNPPPQHPQGQYGQQNTAKQAPQNPLWQQQQRDGTGPLPPQNMPNQYAQPQQGQLQQRNVQLPGTGPLSNLPMQPPQQQLNQARTIMLERAQRSVGILGGPNGRGTGIFVTRDGLAATTRYVAGGEEQLEIELLDGRRLLGQVVRAFPDLDLALIQTPVQLRHLMQISKAATLPDNAPIVAVTHQGEGLRSTKRATQHATPAHFFPTMINQMRDAGGNPIFDGQNLLVGLLTKNAVRSNGYLYGLYMARVYQSVQRYLQEKQQLAGQRSTYCPACGILSRAPAFGGFYCENCGNTLPFALELTRFPQPNLIRLYGENIQRPCPNCDSQVGYYRGACMRCGYEL